MERFSLDSASKAYRARREELRQAEIALKDQVEKVAALRRALPADTPVKEDYAFTEAGPKGTRTVRLSELFAPGHDALVVYHYMWAPADDAPCPMCTMWTDGYNAVAPHVTRTAPMVVVTKQDAARMLAFAEKRGWRNLRVVSSGSNSFNRDFGMEDAEGHQMPGVSVFLKGKDGRVRHFYTMSAIMGDDNYRGMDLLSPVWNMLDLLPQGRGEWFPSVAYD
ncbi:MAG TPA: DUF899 family protein [Alphaproteobacteria bacterium]